MSAGSETANATQYLELVDRLRERFPELMPISKLPILRGYRGTGVTAVGKYEPDQQTSSYLTTIGITFRGVPVYMIGTYRVIDVSMGTGEPKTLLDDLIILNLESTQEIRMLASRCCQTKGGLHFVGKEPLSEVARAWNAFVVIVLVGLVIWVARSWSSITF